MSKKDKRDAKRVKVSIPAELAEAVEATGADLDATVERLLRDALGHGTADRTKGKLAGLIQDLAGPHLPQLEAIAKDVASKVAKDVATAATAAALAAFTAKATAKPGSGDKAERADKSKAAAPKRTPRKTAGKPPSAAG